MENVNMLKIEHRITEVEQRSKSNTHRLEERGKSIKD